MSAAAHDVAHEAGHADLIDAAGDVSAVVDIAPEAGVGRADVGSKGLLPRAVGMDWWLFAVAIALATIGVVMAFSASYHLAVSKHHDELYFLDRHLRYAGVALVATLVGAAVPYQLWRKAAPWLLLGAAGLLVLVLWKGETRNRATRWIFGFQPAELAKVAFIFYLARVLVNKAERGALGSFVRVVVPLLGVLMVFVALLMKQPDMGTALVLGVLLLGMALVAGANITPLIATFVVLAAAAAAFIAQNPTRLSRVQAWLDPFEHFHGKGYQLANSVLAVAMGGPFGRGLGASHQKLGFLPEAHTDFVLAILAEELGVVGVSLVAALFLVLLYRGAKIAIAARDEFGRLLAFGIVLLIGTQAAVNFGVVLGMLPTKGLTLPLVSYGGTSLVVMAFAIGVVLNVGRGGDPHATLPELTLPRLVGRGPAGNTRVRRRRWSLR